MHKQFSRPSITVGDDEKREWRTSHAGTLRVGDIVHDFGKIEKFEFRGGAFYYENPLGEGRMFGWSDVVFAFTATGDNASA